MIWLYVAAAIFGCTFLIPMVLGGLDSGVEGAEGLGDGLDGGLDVDLDVDGHADDTGQGGVEVVDANEIPGDVGGDPLGAVFSSLLSFRTLVFFAAFFGTSGIVFDILGYSSAVTAATAVLIGLIAAFANSVLFGLIRDSQPNSQISERELEGRPGRVVLPMDTTSRGRIRIDLSGQPQFLVAQPAEGQGPGFDVGDSVVVVSFENGTATVASLAELEDGIDNGPSSGQREES